MFEAADHDRDRARDQIAGRIAKSNRQAVSGRMHKLDRCQPSEAVLTVLEAGFRARVMSWQSAYDLGARSGLSLEALKERADQCARLIQAGLGHAVDETLFAALVYHYADIAKDLSRTMR